MRGQQQLATTTIATLIDILQREHTITTITRALDCPARGRRDNESESTPETNDPGQLCLSSIHNGDTDWPAATMDTIEPAEDVPALPLHHTED